MASDEPERTAVSPGKKPIGQHLVTHNEDGTVGLSTSSMRLVRVRTPSGFGVAAVEQLLTDIRRVRGVGFAAGEDIPLLEGAIYGSSFESPLGARPTGDVISLGVTAELFAAAGLTAPGSSGASVETMLVFPTRVMMSRTVAEIARALNRSQADVLRILRDEFKIAADP
jgi:hypothetical protein